MGSAAFAGCGACSDLGRAGDDVAAIITKSEGRASPARGQRRAGERGDERQPRSAPSNRCTLESAVRPCPSANTLRVAAAEGVARARACPEYLELIYAASMGEDVHVGRLLGQFNQTRDIDWTLATEPDGSTALLKAARNGHLRCVQLLLRHDAEQDVQNVRGDTALHCACAHGHAEVVSALCDAGADPLVGDLDGAEAPGFKAVRYRVGATHRHQSRNAASDPKFARYHVGSFACGGSGEHLERSLGIVEACLEAMAKSAPGQLPGASLVNVAGVTGLHLAAAASDVEACALLIQSAANIDSVEMESGITPLMRALAAGAESDTLDVLFEAAANLRCRDTGGGSVLHYAVGGQLGHKTSHVVERLLHERADPDAHDERGVTPVALAALFGSADVLRLLLANGARPQHCRAVLPRMPMATGPILEAVL